MRIAVKLCTEDVAPPAELLAYHNHPPCHRFGAFHGESEAPMVGHKPWKCRGRGGRGGRGGLNKQQVAERFDAKINRLTERHVNLTAKLVEDLPEEKVRGLEWRLNHLQNKIDTLKAKKQQKLALFSETEENKMNSMFRHLSVDDMDTEGAAAAAAVEEEGESPIHSHPLLYHHRGGRGGRGGRGCHGSHGGHPWVGKHQRGGGRGGHHHWDPHHPHPHPHFHQDEGFESKTEEHQEGGHGCGRGGPSFLHAVNTPDGKAAFERLQAARSAVMAARRSEREGGPSGVTQAEMEELKEAKLSWRLTKKALWAEKCSGAVDSQK